MKHIRTTILMALVLTLAACDKLEQPIAFNGDVSEAKVVMQSRLTAGDSMAVRMCYSRFFLDATPFRMIDNATLELKVNGMPVPAAPTYSKSDYKYHFDYLPTPGDTLDITARVPGLNPVTAHTVIPQTPVVDNTSATYSGYNSDSREHQYVVNLRLADQPDEKNFYVLSVEGSIDQMCSYTRINERQVYDTIPIADTFYIVGPRTVYDTIVSTDTSTIDIAPTFTCRDYLIADPQSNLFGNMIDEDHYSELYFDDSRINGMRHDIQLTIQIAGYMIDDYMTDDYWPTDPYRSRCTYDKSTLKLAVTLTSISRDLYLYDQSTYSIDDGLGGIISEPVQIHNNINGGIGIFAGQTTVTIPINVSNATPRTDK